MSETVKLVIEIPEEVVRWFKEKGFIPIGQYLMVNEAMKKAEPLSEVLAEIKGEIEDLEPENGFEGFYKCQSETLEIINKHISGEGDSK